MVSRLTKILVVFTAVALVLYDVYAVVAGGKEATISWIVLQWSKVYPIIPFALGVVIGHMFWKNDGK